MKRVLIIAPDFSPSSYPPALRVRFFVEHLKEFGWDPIVLTMRESHYEWDIDLENNQLLSSDLEVIRTSALPIRITRKLGIGDIGLRTFLHHWRAASSLCQTKAIDLVFIPVPPYYPAVLGRLLYHFYKIPYVIDYIDPWVYDDYWRRSRNQRSLKRTTSHVISSVLEPFALKHVSHLVGVSSGTTAGVVRRHAWLNESETTEIPYGAPTKDFEYLKAKPRKNSIFKWNDGRFHMSYVGRGGTDMRPALSAVFEAISIGLRSSPELFGRLRLHFVGTTYAANGHGKYQILPLAKQFGLEAQVEEYPSRVSYLDALQILLDSNALLVVGSDRPHYTASKIFPYILAQKPLLAIFHEASNAIEIIKEAGAGEAVTFGTGGGPGASVSIIADRLKQFLLLPHDYQPSICWHGFERYTTRAMTAKLAQTFNKAIKQVGHSGIQLKDVPTV